MATYGWDEGYDFAYKEITEYPIYEYFHENGDEIEARVNERLREAVSLLDDSYSGAALVCAITAIEIIVRGFTLRPLVRGRCSLK